MNIHAASPDDFDRLLPLDHHISAAMLAQKNDRQEVLVAKNDAELVGWLRFGYFWDNLPFMNLLFALEPHRGNHIGTKLVLHSENAMQAQGLDQVFTSTLADETAQYFYRKLGYIDCGALFLPGEAAEIILRKPLGRRCNALRQETSPRRIFPGLDVTNLPNGGYMIRRHPHLKWGRLEIS